MSRVFPGNSTIDHLTSGNAAIWSTANTNLCAMAIINPSQIPPGADLTALVAVGTTGGGGRLSVFDLGTGNVCLRYTKLAVAHVTATATTAFPASAWRAVMASGTTGGNVTFKSYDYGTSTLFTETITDTSSMNAPGTSPARVGFGPSGLASESFYGTIDRAVVGQGIPTDGEFTTWARSGVLPTTGFTVLGHWILSPAGTSVSPEDDLTANNNDLVVTGTTASAAFALPDAGNLINVGDGLGVGDVSRVPV